VNNRGKKNDFLEQFKFIAKPKKPQAKQKKSKKMSRNNTLEEEKKKTIEIYGFSGKMGSGKDYFANKLMFYHKNNAKTMIIAFADFLKSLACVKHDLSYDDVYGSKNEKTRKILQEMGDAIRTEYGEDFFAKALQFEIEKQYRRNHISRFIITDVRFPEEVKVIKSMGGKVIRLNAPDRTKERLYEECNGDKELMKQRASHRSENSLDDYRDFDLVLFNTKTHQSYIINTFYSWVDMSRNP
jgi:phosphomevalonate kinase